MSQISGIKKLLIILLSFVVLISPIGGILLPIQFIGNLFKNAWGTMQDYFGYDYSGNFSEEVDTYVAQHRISLNYNQLLGCALTDIVDNPVECLNYDEHGNILSNHAESELFTFDYPEYHGKISDSYFKKIHVLGKYTTSNYEKVGEHTEKELIGHRTTIDGKSEPIYKTVIVEDYDWVYHPELKRGACENSDTQICYITLEDRDVYPFNYSGAYISDRYGITVDVDTFDIDIMPNQTWTGSSIFAFSKGKVIEANSSIMKIEIQANHIDLIATYEGNLDPLFHEGEIVEATELIAYCSGSFTLSTQKANGEYINPSLFYESVILPHLLDVDQEGWGYPFDRYYIVTERVGMYAPFGQTIPHNGVDFGAPCGTPVYNVRAGTIYASGYNDSRGNYVDVLSYDGYIIHYYHLSSIHASAVGQEIPAGGFIGYVGNTGASKGCHLHLGVQKGGSIADYCNIVDCNNP